MKVDVIKIGNSHGIRIPKAILEQCQLEGTVEMQVEDQKLIILPAKKPREGWDEAFQKMAEEGDDELLLPDSISPEPEDIDWEW